MRRPKAKRGGQRNSQLTRLVLETYGRACWLKLPGCTGVATTKDHIIPYSAGGTDQLDNLRPACRPCNSKRRNLTVSGHGATIKVIIGPPASGKTTYVREHAEPHDVIIDLDEIARALMAVPSTTTHVYPPHIRHLAIGARTAAVDRARRLRERVTVWLIHAIPKPDELYTYQRLNYDIIVVDPGRATVEQRVRTMRPTEQITVAQRWYATYPNGIQHLTTAPQQQPDHVEADLDPTSQPTLSTSRVW